MKARRLVFPAGFAGEIATIFRVLAVHVDQWGRDIEIELAPGLLADAAQEWAAALEQVGGALEDARPLSDDALHELKITHGYVLRELVSAASLAAESNGGEPK